METRNERLKYLRKKVLGKNQYELADSLGITQSAISNAESGKDNDFLSKDNLDKLANIFKVNMNWLLNGEGEPLLSDSKIEKKSFGDGEKIRAVVVNEKNEERVSYIPEACLAGFAEEYPDGDYERYTVRFSVPGYNNGSAIGMKVKGDSMYSTLRSGDIVIAEPVLSKEHIENDEPYIIFHKFLRPMIKRIRKNKDGATYFYYSDNLDYEGDTLKFEDTLFLFQFVMKISYASEMPEDVRKYVNRMDQVLKQNSGLIEMNTMLLKHQLGVPQNINL